jgi:hypothetical protein
VPSLRWIKERVFFSIGMPGVMQFALRQSARDHRWLACDHPGVWSPSGQLVIATRTVK